MGKNLNKTVFVGMSGGVDSSVSAALLKEAIPKNYKKLFGRPTPKGFSGYNVVGVFIHTWQPDFIECTWRDERRDAMRVCAHLNIPFLECDGVEAYKKGVADYMINEYKNGNTPNPDVMCNREVKFGVFWQFAKKHGADFIATGHYARVNSNNFREVTGGGVPFSATAENGVKELRENIFELKQGVDESKDQSYFLWTLNQDDLSHTLFPVGHLEKKEVRKLAEKYKIPVATKKDSQGVCFLGPLDMKDFLKHYIESKEGNVLDKDGVVIGHHDGAVFFTLGERHGFTITKNTDSSKALYVVSKDIDKNTITVSTKIESYMKHKDLDTKLESDFSSGPRGSLPAHSEKSLSSFCLKQINWINGNTKQDKKYTAQIRYHGEQLDCYIINDVVSFENETIVSSGQSIVVYDGDICMGGGVVV